MTLRHIDVDWSQMQTYKSEVNLIKRIDAEKRLYPDYDDRFVIVRTPDGRWTAIVMLDRSKGGYLGRYPFMKV
jgi:hypothetical protein